MSTRRQTRRTKRVCRLSGSEDLPWTMDITDGSDDTQNNSIVQSNPSTPAPKRAANEMGDVQQSATKRQAVQINTPNNVTSVAISDTVADSPRNVAPTVPFDNRVVVDTDALERWEAVIEKLNSAAPMIGSIGTETPAPSGSRVEKTSVTELSTEDLCAEMMQRLKAIDTRSEAEKRQIAQDRGTGAINALREVMNKMRDEPRARQYLEDVQTGRVNDPEYGPAPKTLPIPSGSNVTALSGSEKSDQTALLTEKSSGSSAENSGHPCNMIFTRYDNNTASAVQKSASRQTENNQENADGDVDISRLVQPSYGNVSQETRDHNDAVVRQLYSEIMAAKNERLAQQRGSQRKRQRYDSDDDGNDGDKIVIPKFDGKDWPAFKSVFESVAAHKKWSPSFKALQLKCQITGAARAALGVINASENWTYEQLVEHFEVRHGRNQTKVEVMVAMDKLYRKPTQTLTSWRDEVITVANTGRSLTEKQYRELTHYTFLRGLGTFPQMLNWVSERDEDETLQSCYELAKRYEREVGTPGMPITRPSRVAAVSTVTEARSSGGSSNIGSVASHQVTAVAAANPALDQVIKASQETTELIEKLKKELAQVKKRSKWRGGRGGRGRGGRGRGSFDERARFEFGRGFHSCNLDPEEIEAANQGTKEGASAPSKSE